jgi:CRP/FNR family transcriptional regulator
MASAQVADVCCSIDRAVDAVYRFMSFAFSEHGSSWRVNARKNDPTIIEVRRSAKMQNRNSLKIQSAVSPSQRTATGTLEIIKQKMTDAAILPRKPDVVSTGHDSSCSVCAAPDSTLCAKVQEKVKKVDWLFNLAVLESTMQTVPPRRSIYHPKEWSEFIPVICQGWAASSITLPDGRRQILSFVLPGDMVSTAGLLDPVSGRTVEAVTEVSYWKFKRSELKAFVFAHPDLLETLSKTMVEERLEADHLALDLGRRPADERIGRLILRLAKRLATRGLMNGRTMEFPLRQRHIADAMGLTPVHVSKMMGEFQRGKLIALSDRSLTILDETELCRIADWR